MLRILFILFFTFCGSQSIFSQEELKLTVRDSVKNEKNNVLAPSKAAFYSAVLPGLGQAYNKKYWKIPIVYAGLGTGIYFYADNNKKYHRFRDEYKKRLNGTSDSNDPYFGNLDNSRIIDGQKFYQRNRDLSVLVTAAIYILNIVDANVDAHLMQFNVNENLSLKPDLYQNEMDYKHNIGLTLNYNF
ncbi:hypothetical protein Q764_04080 [Flavobacterium suncheonense GH29-5 = DSM 17707]|uniref:DUF5683 domain-containing protein n=1 Tax=Flavobacterium suncheonense GH29-5 = DSM 17707 TaxID=1121899 RepID=A0A0A2MC55_9FLAO|nr:hypothetical protein Q764_04080 [Flavobacterium suncheonense GH29-5 = DSM 17707]